MGDAVYPTLVLNATADDAAALAQVLGALTEQGFTVQTAPVRGEELQPRHAELHRYQSTAAVLTVWSRGSIQDEDVVSKASDAMRRGRLLPMRIEDVEPPIGFRQVQTFDLVHLVPEAASELARHIRLFLGLDKTEKTNDRRLNKSLLGQAARWLLYNILMVAILYCFASQERMTRGDYAFLLWSFPVVISNILLIISGFPRDLFSPADSIRVFIEAVLHSRYELYVQLSAFFIMIIISIIIASIFNIPYSASELLLLGALVALSIIGAVLLRYVLIRVLWRLLRRPQVSETPHG